MTCTAHTQEAEQVHSSATDSASHGGTAAVACVMPASAVWRVTKRTVLWLKAAAVHSITSAQQAAAAVVTNVVASVVDFAVGLLLRPPARLALDDSSVVQVCVTAAVTASPAAAVLSNGPEHSGGSDSNTSAAVAPAQRSAPSARGLAGQRRSEVSTLYLL
jgi:hypothetical protein